MAGALLSGPMPELGATHGPTLLMLNPPRAMLVHRVVVCKLLDKTSNDGGEKIRLHRIANATHNLLSYQGTRLIQCLLVLLDVHLVLDCIYHVADVIVLRRRIPEADA